MKVDGKEGDNAAYHLNRTLQTSNSNNAGVFSKNRKDKGAPQDLSHNRQYFNTPNNLYPQKELKMRNEAIEGNLFANPQALNQT